MCKMEESSEVSSPEMQAFENVSPNGLPNHFDHSVEENGLANDDEHYQSVVALAHELAHAGDELVRRFSTTNNARDETPWDRVWQYAVVLAIRVLLGQV